MSQLLTAVLWEARYTLYSRGRHLAHFSGELSRSFYIGLFNGSHFAREMSAP
jgi:hypothetical protein